MRYNVGQCKPHAPMNAASKSDDKSQSAARATGAGKRTVPAAARAPVPTRVKFWGVRGSIPTPGPTTVKYGGNTSCVEVRIGGEIILLDAGTGLRALARSLLSEFKDQPLNLTMLLTHM